MTRTPRQARRPSSLPCAPAPTASTRTRCWTALLIRHASWLRREDFRNGCIHVGTGTITMAAIDWPAAMAALGNGLPCSEQRMLRLTASIAEGIPVGLRETLTGIDRCNLGLLTSAIRRAAGQHP